MEQPTPRQTFGKAEKLCSKKSIDLLFEKGNTFYISPIKVLFLKSQAVSVYPVQVLISVPKKHLKHATDRNFMKRILREAYRKHKYLLTLPLIKNNEVFLLALIYTGKQLADYTKVEAIIEKVFKRLLMNATQNEQQMD
jgi:ribonuclease P protein component